MRAQASRSVLNSAPFSRLLRLAVAISHRESVTQLKCSSQSVGCYRPVPPHRPISEEDAAVTVGRLLAAKQRLAATGGAGGAAADPETGSCLSIVKGRDLLQLRVKLLMPGVVRTFPIWLCHLAELPAAERMAREKGMTLALWSKRLCTSVRPRACLPPHPHCRAALATQLLLAPHLPAAPAAPSGCKWRAARISSSAATNSRRCWQRRGFRPQLLQRRLRVRVRVPRSGTPHRQANAGAGVAGACPPRLWRISRQQRLLRTSSYTYAGCALTAVSA